MENEKFSNAEKLDMIVIYGECKRSRRQSRTLYEERFPERQQSSCMYFARLEKKLKQSGSLKKKRTKRQQMNISYLLYKEF